MHVNVIDRQPARIVCLRYVGPYGPPLGRYWKTVVDPWITRRGLREREIYAIGHDDPDVTPPDQCRCDIGVVVDDAFLPIGDEHVTTVPGGRYATTRFSGTPERLHASWQRIVREWLPASGLQLDARPMFEYYGPGMSYDEATGVFDCDITIPVRPL